MLHAWFPGFAAIGIAAALAAQAPFDSTQHWQHEHHLAALTGLRQWSLDELPNPNATDHLIFETVHSLLQHWPNTRMRNGHNVVPGIIPEGALLYHGRTDKEFPAGPDWVATDPEHAYIFCHDVVTRTKTESWLLTLMVTRPLKIVYFDGSSAAKLPYGSLDTQDLLAWGRMGELFEGEAKRIQALCEWGKVLGVDGFVRMQMDFEVMLCDFTSGVTVVSFESLVDGWTNQSMIPAFNTFEAMAVGSWHYQFPGETRIQLDLSGLVSFYDTQLASSLVPIRAGQERWDHRVANISSEDLAAIKSKLTANLIKAEDTSSGIDWRTLIQVIVDRFAQRLELTRYLVNSRATNPADILDLAKKAQTQLRIMLTPYLLTSAVPSGASHEAGLDWTIPIYRLCATTHTRSMESQFDRMTDSEKLILRAVRGTSKEICRTVTKMWATGVHAGIDPLLDTKDFPDISEVTRLRKTWTNDLDRLMGWLDWYVWVKCDSGCGPEEMCYLPTWPIGFPWLADFPGPTLPEPGDDLSQEKLTSFELRTIAMKRVANELSSAVKPERDEWVRPQPKCIRRIRPYTF